MRCIIPLLMSWAALSPTLFAGPTSQPATNPRLAAMPANSWLQIGPPPPAPKGIMAYSGGAFDTTHNAILIFGGGHADYWGNEVCAFDVATLAWKRMYAPDAEARYTNDNIDNTCGKLRDSDRPYTRHSYQMLTFVPSAHKMFIWSGCGPGWGQIRPTCPSPRDAWYYDLADNKWQLLTTDGPSGFGGGTCYDPKRDVVWALEGTSWPALWCFDVKAARWSKRALKPESPAGCHLNLVYNARRDVILAAVASEGKWSYLIDPATAAVTRLDTTAFRPQGHGGLAMLPDHDAAVALVGDSKLGLFDFATKRWLPLAGPDGGPKMLGFAVYGRLWHSPIDKVVLFVGPAGTWAYKPPARFALPPASQPAGGS
jgi:hypothetical protein